MGTMWQRAGTVGLVVTMLLTVSGVRAADPPAVEMTPLLATVLTTPRAVPRSDGQRLMPYEIELTNVTDAPVTVESVEVRDPRRDSEVVGSFATRDVASMLILPGGKTSATLGAGQTGVLLVNLPLAGSETPQTIEHWITVTNDNPKGQVPPRLVEKVARTEVDIRPPVVVGPPLRGARWVAAASCCNSYHRKALLPINGQRYLAQRFAIDWIQLDAQDRVASGDPARNESYPQFGAEAVAVADGVVTHVIDGVPEGTPGKFPPGITLATADGNSVVLDLGGGRYALYAHFQPGSIRVKAGDKVRRGQVLGLVGNSGNSDAPHLHFHIMDGPSPLASNGLPYVIDTFEVTGYAVSPDDLETELKHTAEPVKVRAHPAPVRHTGRFPDDLAIVNFGM